MNKWVNSDVPFFMALPAVIWQLFFFYIPVAIVLGYSFMQTVGGVASLTLENYSFFLRPLFLMVIANSLILALVTAVLCLVIAYPIAYCLALRIKKYKNAFLFFLILPFWTSLMVQVYAWFFILEHDGLINSLLIKAGLIGAPLQLLNTPFAVYTVMLYCYLPFMIMPLYTALEKIDKRMIEAAADLGATQWQTFKNVTIPLSLPGIKTGFFLVFVPSFGEFVVPTLLGGGKKLYVGTLITQYFLFARNVYLGSAFTMLSGLALLVAVALIYWYFSRTSISSKTGNT